MGDSGLTREPVNETPSARATCVVTVLLLVPSRVPFATTWASAPCRLQGAYLHVNVKLSWKAVVVPSALTVT
jgi:hypothetical protein